MPEPEETPEVSDDITTDDDGGSDDAQTDVDTDKAAQAASGDAKKGGDDESDLDPRVKAKIEKANREAHSLRRRLKELEPLAAKAKQLEDANKTEVEKLAEQLTAAQVELQGFRVEGIRRKAASDAGLDPELAEFITAVEEEEAADQAKRLVARLGKSETKRTDLKQGARPPAPQEMTRDDLIRGLAGYRR